MSLEGGAQPATAGPPTTTTPSDAEPKIGADYRPLHNTPLTFAVDVSASTHGPTLAAEKAFIKSVVDLLSPRARFESKILPWDHTAHPIRSLAGLDSLEDRGGTDPTALLSNARHSAALKGSSLWFLMTDGLVPPVARVKFAHDIAKHGIHGISCIIVVFGDPSSGPASCDISVGVSVFAAVPDCALLFCNKTDGDLRVMQTKGSFNVLLKGRSHPVFDESSRWDLLPQVSAADFSAISVPTPKRLKANEFALQDSLVINMDDLFADRLSADEVHNILSNGDDLDSVRMTMQAREKQDVFRHWLTRQIIQPDDPGMKQRPDLGDKAQSLFTELVNLLSRGQPLPSRLQSRLRTAYQENMSSFIDHAQSNIRRARERSAVVKSVSANSYSPIAKAQGISPSIVRRGPCTSALPYQGGGDEDNGLGAGPTKALQTPQHLITYGPLQSPGAPPRGRTGRERDARRSCYLGQKHWQNETERSWGNWETDSIDESLRGLLYTTGLRSTKGSFKSTCPLCGASGITMSWLFRAASSDPYVPATPDGGTEGFPLPGSHTRLAFPLAMGHFKETSGALALLSSLSATPPRAPSLSVPILVCDPCSVMFTRNEALSFGITAALPIVRFTENRKAFCGALMSAFEGRFAEDDLPQVFLSVLMLMHDKMVATTPRLSSSPDLSEMNFDISGTMATAAAAVTFRAAVEWTVRDLLHSVVALRELTESFLPPSNQPAPVLPLAAVLGGSFEELDWPSDGGPLRPVSPLLQYPLPGFITILKLAPLLKIDTEARIRATFRRLLYLICEELSKAAEQVPSSQSVAQLLIGLLGRWPPASLQGRKDDGEARLEPSVSVSIQSLLSSSLLSASSYSMMSRAAEFRYFEDPACTWIGPALALFLHALFSQVIQQPGFSAASNYQAVMAHQTVANTLLRPEGLGTIDISDILAGI